MRGRGLMLSAAIAIAAPACVPGAKDTLRPGAVMAQAIVDPYLKIQTALARDVIDDVKANAGNIATAATALGAPGVRIDMAAVQLTAASDLAEARDRFGALSDAIITYMEGLHLTPPPGVRVASCPMLKKSWLQEGSTIANPYYGSEMPTCGDFR
jgi:membrane fusion protein, copper/silver efflux system